MGEIVREKKIMYKIESGLVSALRDLKMPINKVAKFTGLKMTELRKRVKALNSLDDCFEPWLSEELIEAAKRVTGKKKYNLERQKLYKKLNPVEETAMCEEAVNSAYKKLYADKMAVIWNRLNVGMKAAIYQYKPEIEAAKRLEGNFIKVPNENLPKSLKGTTLPFLVLAYDKNKLEICGDGMQIASIYIKNIPVPKNSTPKELETISWAETYKACCEYFNCYNYDLTKNLHEQITERATKDLVPLAINRRAALLTARATILG